MRFRRDLFGVSGQDPAEIGEAVEVAQDFGIELFFAGAERGDVALGATAGDAGEIERGGKRRITRDHPVFGIKRLVFFELGDDGGDAIGHGNAGQFKPVLRIARPVIGGGGQFAHDNDEVFLRGEDLLGDEGVGANGAGEAEGGCEFIDAAVGVHAWIGFGDAPPVHERGFSFVAGSGDDGHREKCRAFRGNANTIAGERPRFGLTDGGLRLGFFHDRGADGLAFLDQLDLAMSREACAGRDEVSHDHVFLEAAQFVHFAQRCRFGENARRILEGGGGNEAISFQRGFGDAQQDRNGFGGFTAFLDDSFVFLLEIELVHLVAPEQRSVAGVGDFHLAQHLAYDDLDVFVVNLDALEAIDLLHFVDQMFLQFLRAADLQDFVRHDGAFGQLLAFLHVIAFEHDDVFGERDEVFFLGAGLGIFDDQAPFTAHGAAHFGNDAVDLGDLGSVLGTARFEQLGNARQTAGNVFCLGDFARRFSQQRAGAHFLAFFHDDMGAGRDGIAGQHFLLLVHNHDLRMQIFLMLDDHCAHESGRFIHLAFDGDSSNHVAEFDLAAVLGEDGDVVRIPLDEGFTFLDRSAIVLGNHGADDDVVTLQLAAFLVVHADRAVFVQHDPTTVQRLHGSQIIEPDRAVVFGFDDRLLEGLAGGATDVEGAHGQLRAGLADGLSGDDAHSFAQLHKFARREVASVTHGANAPAAFAGQHGTDFELFNADALQFGSDLLVDVLVDLDDFSLLINWVGDRFAAHAADDALAKIDHFLVALVNGTHHDAVDGAAILFGDDDVLGGVHEFARQISGIGRVEGGIGETLAGAVRGDEVFQYAQAFAEVGNDRALDDFAAGLGHQAAHTGELAHLLSIAARAGIDHEKDGIVFLAILIFLQLAEHDVGNLVTGVGPDIDDFVVALAVGDDAAPILLLDEANLFVGIFQLGLLPLRDDHVLDSNGDPGPGGFAEPEFLQFIQRGHGDCGTRCPVTAPDDIAELLFAGRFIEETKFGWPNLVEYDATGSGLDDAGLGVAKNGLLPLVRILEKNSVVRFDGPFDHGKFHFRGVRKEGQAAILFSQPRVLRDVITAQGNVLTGRGDWFAAGGRENVVGCQHEHARYQLGVHREGDVHGHLVAVEIGIVSCANQRMNANGFPLDQQRLESLDGQAMQSRRAIQQYGMTFCDFLQNVPHFRRLPFNHFLGAAHGVHIAQVFEPPNDEGLEEHQRHLLWQTALMQF